MSNEFKVTTNTGGTVSLISLVLMFILFVSEFTSYMTITRTEHIVVDTTIGQRLRINFNITFHALTCSEANLDAMDISGEQHLDAEHSLFKHRLSSNGELIGEAEADTFMSKKAVIAPLPADYCGPCYGAAEDGVCCNDCAAVKRVYQTKGWDVSAIKKISEQCIRESADPFHMAQKGEGCNIAGHLLVNKVAGNLHVALGDSHIQNGRHVHNFDPMQAFTFNVSHTIHSLYFGDAPFPGQVNPLDGLRQIVESSVGTYTYHVRIVPTTFEGRGQNITTFQFSETHEYRDVASAGFLTGLPGIFVVYDLSPFMVSVTESSTPFFQFVTGLCAIIGGVFTISGVLDALLYAALGDMDKAHSGGGLRTYLG